MNTHLRESGDHPTLPPAPPERVAILVPYTGKSMPVWFGAFLVYAQFGSELVDWYIIVTSEDLSGMSTPPNVHVLHVSLSQLCRRLLAVDARFAASSAEEQLHWVAGLSSCVEHYPYLMVEFKPCLGFVFRDLLTGYSHWGYADIDLLLGRTPGFLTPQILRSFDIYTSSFGDVSRMYLRGQFAVFRTSEPLLQLWRRCEYFGRLTERISAALQQQQDGRHSWRFESAEGCISRAAFVHNNLSALVVSSQLSDAFRAPVRDKEAFFLGTTLMRCYELPLPALHQTAGRSPPCLLVGKCRGLTACPPAACVLLMSLKSRRWRSSPRGLPDDLSAQTPACCC